MRALADALRALMPFAEMANTVLDSTYVAARDVLRKHAPCDRCGGSGNETGVTVVSMRCYPCNGAGWTPASVEAAIARAEERDRFFDRAMMRAIADAERGNDDEEFHRLA